MLYASFNDSAMRRAQGDQQKADYLLDCSWFEYYQRLVNYNNYCEYVKGQNKTT